MKEIFHIEEIHGHDNKDGRISRRLKEALAVLKERGYTPRNDMRVDAWGQWKPKVEIDLVPGVTRVIFRNNVTHDGETFYAGRVASFLTDGDMWYISPIRNYRQDDETFVLPPIRLARNAFHPDSDFTSADCYCMFAYKLQCFLELAETYKHDIWRSDQVFDGGRVLYGVLPKTFQVDYDDSSSSEEQKQNQSWADVCAKADEPASVSTKSWAEVVKMSPHKLISLNDQVRNTQNGPIRVVPYGLHGLRKGDGFVIPVRDSRGCSEVETYLHAMQLHLESLQKSDGRAQAWFEVAIQLPGAPAGCSILVDEILLKRGD